MRVLILTPSVFPSITGNAVTAERWRRSLSARGILVEVLSSAELDSSGFLERLHSFQPDLIHVHHAYKTGALLTDPQVNPKILVLPMVVSPGGTDINLDLAEAGRKETTRAVLTMARRIIAQSLEAILSLREKLPYLADRILYVPKASIWFGSETFDLREMAGCRDDSVLFFLPAGVRPVKGNIECLTAMQKVCSARPSIRFAAAGPAVDKDYAQRFEALVESMAEFACWIRSIPPTAMQSAYEQSDVVLNTSFSEGLSNSLLEAIAAGRPILASNVTGNREPVLGQKGDAPAGLLFDPLDSDDFVEKAIRLVDDNRLRSTLGSAAGRRKIRISSPENEVDGLMAAYRAAIES